METMARLFQEGSRIGEMVLRKRKKERREALISLYTPWVPEDNFWY